jgi:tetratricopeptide (TPR) repeat protein
LFGKVLERDPGDARAHLGLGRIALARDDLAYAAVHFRRCVGSAPKFKAAHANLAVTLKRLDDDVGAAAELSRMRDVPEEWAWPDPYLQQVAAARVGEKARLAAARALHEAGRDNEAAQAARDVVHDYPNSANAHFTLGLMLAASGVAETAEPELREAIRLAPDWSAPQLELGYVLQAQHDVGAADAYRRAIALQPDFGIAYYNLGLCLRDQGDRAGAVDALGAAVRYLPDKAVAYRDLGAQLAADGRDPEAAPCLERAVQLDSEDEEAARLLHETRARRSRL